MTYGTFTLSVEVHPDYLEVEKNLTSEVWARWEDEETTDGISGISGPFAVHARFKYPDDSDSATQERHDGLGNGEGARVISDTFTPHKAGKLEVTASVYQQDSQVATFTQAFDIHGSDQ